MGFKSCVFGLEHGFLAWRFGQRTCIIEIIELRVTFFHTAWK
jgi:hypothetical protein